MHNNPDYAEMESTIRELNDSSECLTSLPCPDLVCPGSLTQDGERIRCDQCGQSVDAPGGEFSILR